MRKDLPVVVALIAYGLLTVGAGYFRLQSIGFHSDQGTRPDNLLDVRYLDNATLAWVHILSGSVLFLLGPLQFSSYLRSAHIVIHRSLGRVLVLSAATAALSAVAAGIWFPAFGGSLTIVATLVAGVWMICCLSMGVYHIRVRAVLQHQQWMIRMFSIALGVSTIRVLFIVCESVFRLPVEQIFANAFAAGLLVNFLFAEWLLHCKRKAISDRSQ